ncbi:MAG: LamG domain-containing protein, partial [Planctomycetes bacterium]|nr:LamG domain-containing protein [Planctomycetota bacterium]
MESRPCGIRLALVVFLAGLTGQSQAQIEVTPDALRARGVLFYAPFEGTAKAAFATGQAEPWVARDVLYAPGVHGQAVQLLAKAARTVKMPDGTTRKYMNAESMLVYEARGNVYPRRGTLAFWVLSPWDASDQNLLTGSNLSGPTVIGISARDVYPSFFDMPRWKAFFGCLFGGECVRGSLARFGSLGQKIIPRWKKDEWHHVAVTWDDRRGFAVYHNGELLDKFEGDIEWDMLEPDTIALGSWPLRWGDLWPVNAEYVFDELLILSRPLSADEVAKVKDGDYVGLRPMTAADWPDETDKRRRRTGLDAAGNRPMIRATADGARETVRQVAVEDVQMKFHRAFALVDGAVGSSVQFQDGGLPFDTPAKFRFHRPSRVNHLVAVMGESKGSRILEEGNAIPDGRSHISLPDRERADFGIFFSGNSEAKEVMFFERQPGVSSAAGGTVFEIGGMIDCGQFPGADRVLLTSLNPCDRPALYAGPGDRGALTRKAMAHTFIVLPGADKDRFVDGLRLVLRLKPAKTQFGGVIRIHDPQIDGRLALEMDYAFEWPSAGTAFPLDISMAAPGLIIPAGGHLVLSVTLDAECEVECGKGSGS